jgi:hypothetical protein
MGQRSNINPEQHLLNADAAEKFREGCCRGVRGRVRVLRGLEEVRRNSGAGSGCWSRRASGRMRAFAARLVRHGAREKRGDTRFSTNGSRSGRANWGAYATSDGEANSRSRLPPLQAARSPNGRVTGSDAAPPETARSGTCGSVDSGALSFKTAITCWWSFDTSRPTPCGLGWWRARRNTRSRAISRPASRSGVESLSGVGRVGGGEVDRRGKEN